ncbi:HAD family hydrolase [Arthrobacter caoxuetaonis]|uniref:HAD family phosphatase n=1 Tax=Arthrobacter caoxuetaonis TaxID=2886935 RepID=A0A9X1SD41_9MICC|nr:HAD family phosphatase [Arthrobacter caoxuetaonis]MCC3283399.1 HAD family phosphatase [Arthrobacter caoxuetaonis]MCC3298798.1 HAD family phosphatase [Arthrobacter caoxuetaonis]USQ55852.1 HAD family phosphatase [Arthrobacter caoxuetaonis]
MSLPGVPVLPGGSASVLQAVLWDMDGTIVDTEPYWIQAEKDLVAAHGGTWTDDDAEELIGQALDYSARRLQQAGVALPVEGVIAALAGEVARHLQQEVPWRPGARELLEELAAEDIPCALVTMSTGPLARLIASTLPEGTFRSVVSGDMVSRGKPHPEPYQLAFDQLSAAFPGLAKSRCLAVEDSYPGYTSAREAGLPALAVPHMVPFPPDQGRIQWDTLAGRSLADLQELAALSAGGAQ